MSREEAQKLLDAWNFFDSNPDKFYEGLPGLSRNEFLVLMQVITGTDDLVEAKIQLANFATSRLEKTVPGTIIEAAREEVLPKTKIDSAKRANLTVSSWIKNIAPKTEEEVQERQVALAQIRAEVEKAEEKVIPTKEAVPPSKEASTAEPSTVGIRISYGPASPINSFRSFGVRSAITGAANKIAKEAPHEALSLYLIANGVTHSALKKEAVEKLSGKEQKAILKIVEGIKNQEIGLTTDIDFELIRRSLPAKSITFLLGSESGLTQGQVFAFLNPEGEVTSFVPHQSFFGKLVSDAGSQLFGKLSEKIASKVLGKAATAVGAKAAVAAVGAVSGPPGWVATLIAYVGPEVVSFIKRNFSKAMITIGAVLFGLGYFLASSALMLGGAATAGAGLIGAAGGVGPALSSAAGFASGLFTAVGLMVVSSLVVPLVATLIGVPIVVALIIFIINSGAYIVPPGPTLEAPSFIGANITCTKEKGPVSFSNTSSSPIAKRAWEITSDLYQGFWCFWNRSPGDFPDDTSAYPPSYPETFDEDLFTRNPNPSPTEMSKCGDCLFWCTYLVQKAYRESGNTSLLVTLWSPTMQDDFTKRGKFIIGRDATPKNVAVGSVIFFKIEPGPDRTNHVAIIYSVNEDGITYVQSNAPTKDAFVPFNSSGKGIQSPPGTGVVGIGLP